MLRTVGSYDAVDLAALASGTTTSVVLPAHNEAATIGAIAATIRRHLMGAGGLIDEVLVIDSGSTHDTAAVAGAAGARVLAATDIRPDLGERPGKGRGAVEGSARVLRRPRRVPRREERCDRGVVGPCCPPAQGW